MAGDWIKMNKSLLRDPRVVRIASACEADILRTVGGLMSVWCLADEQTEDGKLSGYSPELIDSFMGFPNLARAMESVGWLTIGDGFVEFPAFTEHNGQSAKRRIQDNVRKMSARKADICPRNVREMSALEKSREEKSILTLTSKNERARGSLSDLKSYALEIGLPESDGEAMHDHWTANGWKNGQSPSKDWKAGMRKWKANGWHPSQKNAPNKPAGTNGKAYTQRGYTENLELP